MSKLVLVGLIAAVMFANPAMAAWYDKNGVVIAPSRVVHCIRAPDEGQFAGGPWNKPPCEPATRGSGTRAAWHDRNGAVVAPSRVVHCIRAPDVGQFAGGPWDKPPCEPATWR
jgi:hypothetical protein